jgi:hypothetical protein
MIDQRFGRSADRFRIRVSVLECRHTFKSGKTEAGGIDSSKLVRYDDESSFHSSTQGPENLSILIHHLMKGPAGGNTDRMGIPDRRRR